MATLRLAYHFVLHKLMLTKAQLPPFFVNRMRKGYKLCLHFIARAAIREISPHFLFYFLGLDKTSLEHYPWRQTDSVLCGSISFAICVPYWGDLSWCRMLDMTGHGE